MDVYQCSLKAALKGRLFTHRSTEGNDVHTSFISQAKTFYSRGFVQRLIGLTRGIRDLRVSESNIQVQSIGTPPDI